MSIHPPTSIRIVLPDAEIEVEGTTAFVEEMYARIEEDLAPLLFPDGRPSRAERERPVWVYGLTPLYAKVYVVSEVDVRSAPIARDLDVSGIRRIYVDGSSPIVASLSGNTKTIWAELRTPATI